MPLETFPPFESPSMVVWAFVCVWVGVFVCVSEGVSVCVCMCVCAYLYCVRVYILSFWHGYLAEACHSHMKVVRNVSLLVLYQYLKGMFTER